MIDKIRSLSKDTLIYGINTVVGRFLNFILVPYYTNKFLPEEYGVVALIYAYIAILNVFFSIGLESGFMRFAALKEIGNEKQNFSNPYIINFMNSILMGAALVFFAKPLSGILQIGAEYSYLIVYMSAILVLDSIVLIPFAALRLRDKAARFSAFKIINITVNVLLNFVLISYFDMGIEAIFISNLIASAVTFLMLIPEVAGNITFSFNKDLIRELLKFSLPYIPAGIAANLVQIIDRPILKSLSDDSTVGIYQANYKLGIFMMLVVSMFEYAWRPFFLNNAKEPDAKAIFSKVLTAFVAAGSIIVLLISVLIEEIVKVKFFGFTLIGKEYWGGLSIVPIVLTGYLFYGMYINFMPGIYLEKKTSYLPLITLAGAAINIAGIFLLYPVAGLNGVALATLLSYLLMMVMIYFVCRKYYPINYEWGKIIFTIFAMSVFYIIFIIAKSNLNPGWYVNLIIPAVYVLLLHIAGIFRLSNLRRLLSSS